MLIITRKAKALLKPSPLLLLRNITESTQLQLAAPNPVNQSQLLRVCTILYQQQNSPESRLNSALNASGFELTHEFFLQVCNRFPLSWRPVHRFFGHTLTRPEFRHSSVSLNKMADVIGKSRNIDLFWEVLNDIGRRGLANDATFRIALTTLARARELKRCVDFFHAMNGFGVEYSSERMNRVVESLCGSKLVAEAKYLVTKLRDWIEPNELTHNCLIKGFCEVGDLIEASKAWNSMADLGFEPDVGTVEAMMVIFFKRNMYDEALKVFKTSRAKNDDLGSSSYGLVIDWLCKRGMVSQAHMVFDEMSKRGIFVQDSIFGSLIYGLVSRGRVREGYKVIGRIENPGMSSYHGLIKGLLRLKRAREATEVFREMIRRGCEPAMHTYVMLLQGHLGKRGRASGSDPLVNFDSIFVGGLVKAGKLVEANKYVERSMKRGREVPRFDYNKFLHYYSDEDGVFMFEGVGRRLREVGLFDLGDIFLRFGEKMATRDRRRNRPC